MEKTPCPADYVKITIFGGGLAVLWTSLHTIVIPVRLLEIVPETLKNTYLSLLTFVGLILAMLVQPVAGAFSDRTTSPRGKRLPFIFFGTLLVVALLPALGVSNAFYYLFISYCCLQIASNIAQGPFQALIPDMIPQRHRGTASGVKSLIEILLAISLIRLVAYFMDIYTTESNSLWLWISLTSLGTIMLTTMIATVFTVKEPGIDTRTQMPPLAKIVSGAYKIDTKRDRNFVWFLTSRLFIFMALGTLQTFAFYFLRDVVRPPNPASVTADLVLTIGALLLASVYPAGYFSDKLGRKPLIIFSGASGIFGILTLYFFPTYYGVLACAGLLGISTGTFLSTNWALATDLVTPGEEARYLGLTNIATAGAGALSRLAGPLIDFFNAREANLGYTMMLIMCVLYLIIGSTSVVLIRRTNADADN